MYTKFYHLINKIFSALNIFVSIFIKVLSSLFVKIIIVTSFFPSSRILLCLVEVSGICYLCEARSQKNAKALQTQQVDLSSQAANSVLFFFIFFQFFFFLSIFTFFLYFFFWGWGLILQSRLAWNSLWSPGWLQIRRNPPVSTPMSSAFNYDIHRPHTQQKGKILTMLSQRTRREYKKNVNHGLEKCHE